MHLAIHLLMLISIAKNAKEQIVIENIVSMYYLMLTHNVFDKYAIGKNRFITCSDFSATELSFFINIDNGKYLIDFVFNEINSQRYFAIAMYERQETSKNTIFQLTNITPWTQEL